MGGIRKRGERLHATAPFGHWKTRTVMAGLRHDGRTAPWVINEPMNREMFDLYRVIRRAPALDPGEVVMQGARVRYRMSRWLMSSNAL